MFFFLLPFFMLFLFLIILLPFKFTLDSLVNIIYIPGQIYKIATNKKLRKNHSIEHATVNILEKQYGYRNLAGYAEEEGFYIMGAQYPEQVLEAAKIGLNALKSGQSELAIHKRCGTSMTAANLVSSVLFLLLLYITKTFSIFNMIIALIFANLAGPWLGVYLQKYLTTYTEVEEIEIKGVRWAGSSQFGRASKIFVETKSIPYLNR
ncbi:MAG: DUF6391 domain-containing protein [Bacillota bacterium]